MKKVWTLAIALFATSVAFAQSAEVSSSSSSVGPGEGDLYLTTLLNYNSGSTKGNVVDANDPTKTNYEKTATNYSFGITPKVGMMVTDQLGVHLSIGGTVNGSDAAPENDGGKSKTSMFNVGVGAKYFLGKGKIYFSPSLDLGVGFGGTKAETVDPNDAAKFVYENTGKVSQFAVGITPAVTYFINSNWSAEVQLNSALSYSSTVNKDKDGKNKVSSSNGFNFDLKKTAVVGITYWLK